MNPIICPVRNGLHLTRKAIKTFKAQDIAGGVDIIVIDNASSDGTSEYLQTQHDIATMHFNPPLSVAASWNRALQWVFHAGADYALVVNNDVELRPDTYRHLVADGGGFVTAVGTRDPGKIKPMTWKETADPNDQWAALTKGLLPETLEHAPFYLAPDPAKKRPHPDFSCYLIRCETYERVGEFDENFLIGYCEDSCYHVRMHRAGIHAEALELPFLHHGAQTIQYADPGEVRKIQIQADKNREYFKRKYGFAVASEEYYRYFSVEPPVEEAIIHR